MSGHDGQHAGSAALRSNLQATERGSAEGLRSDRAGGKPAERAKHLRLGSVNPAMHERRVRVVSLLVRLFGEEKQIALAAMFGVSRTLALRWLDLEMVDKNPAPLALLLTVDEESFERVVAELRADRAAMRDGR